MILLRIHLPFTFCLHLLFILPFATLKISVVRLDHFCEYLLTFLGICEFIKLSFVGFADLV